MKNQTCFWNKTGVERPRIIRYVLILCLALIVPAGISCTHTPRPQYPGNAYICWIPDIPSSNHYKGLSQDAETVKAYLRDKAGFEQYLADTAGGWTAWKVSGGWVDNEGVTHREDGLFYFIALSEISQMDPRELGRRIRNLFDQRTAFVIRIPCETFFMTP